MGDGLNERARDAGAVAAVVARRSYGRLVAFLAARTRDLAAAEDALAEAFAAALVDWPAHGCPDNPEGWLLTTARRRLIDATRRRQSDASTATSLAVLVEALGVDFDPADEAVMLPDRRLALLFACAHPSIDPSIRAPLMLQAVLGLDAKRIGAAFMIAPATIGKRLVRAKAKIRDAGIPFRVPERDDLPERLDAVLAAIYAAFGEGWVDTTGLDPIRRDLALEAIFLAGLVVELMPTEPEALGLLALLLHAEARRAARRDRDGRYVSLDDQDCSRWDGDMIRRAEALIVEAAAFDRLGRYQLEAALQSAHVARRRSGNDRWDDVVAIYDAIATVAPSPVVTINRAVAIARRDGALAGLDALDVLAADPRMRAYQPYWAARADLLAQAGQGAAAADAYRLAIELEADPAVRAFLEARRARVAH